MKIDVEGAENKVFDTWFYKFPHVLDKIKQIGMEIHPGHQKGISIRFSSLPIILDREWIENKYWYLKINKF